jgi:hypothetical protein
MESGRRRSPRLTSHKRKAEAEPSAAHDEHEPLSPAASEGVEESKDSEPPSPATSSTQAEPSPLVSPSKASLLSPVSLSPPL